MAETEISRLKKALQKIADLPLEQVGNRRDPRVRARRIAMAALGAKKKDVTNVGRRSPPRVPV